MKTTLAVIALMLCAVGAKAQAKPDFVQATIPKTQQLLEGFTCPEGGHPKACQSFKELVVAGEKLVKVPSSMLQVPRDVGLSCVYVVFDDTSDNFWLVSILDLTKNHKPSLLLTYAHYQNGFLASTESAEVPFVEGKTGFSKDGISIWFSGTTVTTSETYKNTDGNGATVTIVIQQSTLRQSIQWKVGSEVHAADGKALQFRQQAGDPVKEIQ